MQLILFHVDGPAFSYELSYLLLIEAVYIVEVHVVGYHLDRLRKQQTYTCKEQVHWCADWVHAVWQMNPHAPPPPPSLATPLLHSDCINMSWI